MVQAAILMAVLIGFTALAVDVGHMCATKGALQNAADAAALAGAAVLVGEDGVDAEAARAGALAFLGEHAVMTAKNSPTTDDIQIGRYDNPLDASCSFVPLSNNSANTVWVTAGREEDDDNGVDLFFAAIFGKTETSLSAQAAASRVLVSSTNLVPVALRTPDFGTVDPEITEANPGKDGPSYPANGEAFENGEEVVLFLFGKGPRSPVHLVLDLPEFNGVAETNKILSGDTPPTLISIGDEMPVWNKGTGDGNFGVKLVDRLENEDPDDDTIVVPIVETIEFPESSRNAKGEVANDIRIVDFVGVRLLRVEEVEVPNPKFPDNPSKNITVQRLIAVVVPVVVSGAGSTVEYDRYAESVVTLQLVR